MKKYLLIITCIILVAACRSTKKIQTAIAKKDSAEIVRPDSSLSARNDSLRFITDVYNQLNAHYINFQTFSAKIKVDYKDADDKKYDVNAFVRMYKDSVIWISVNAIFGIEALRAYITKDSVKLLDKQNKVYTARAVSYLQEVSALPLDLHTLQDLIIGNPVFLDSNIVAYSNNSDEISLINLGKYFKNLITLTASDKFLRRSKLDDIKMARNRTGDLTYSDYENKKGVHFSTKRKITIAEKKKLDIELDFKQYDFNEELTFPFSVPKNYKTN